MPADFSSQGTALEDAPDFAGQGVPLLPAAKLPPDIADEPLLRPPSVRPYDYLTPLPPISAAQLAADKSPWLQRPGLTLLADEESGVGIPRIPVMGAEGSKLRGATEFGRSAQESFASGVEGMTTPEAALTYPLFAVPYMGPALASVLGTKVVSGGMGELVTGAELHDPRIAGTGFGKVLAGSPLLARGLGLPARASEAARVAAARNITPGAPPKPSPPPLRPPPEPPVTPTPPPVSPEGYRVLGGGVFGSDTPPPPGAFNVAETTVGRGRAKKTTWTFRLPPKEAVETPAQPVEEVPTVAPAEAKPAPLTPEEQAAESIAELPNQPYPERTPAQIAKEEAQARRLIEERYRFSLPEVQRQHGIDPKTGLIPVPTPEVPAAAPVETPQPAEPAAPPERIVAVAVRHPETGQITSGTGTTHAQLYEQAGIDTRTMPTYMAQSTSGFLTDKGRFVVADEAARVAHAAKQVEAGEFATAENLGLDKPAAPPSPAPEAPAFSTSYEQSSAESKQSGMAAPIPPYGDVSATSGAAPKANPENYGFVPAVKTASGEVLTGPADAINPHQEIEAAHNVTGARVRGWLKDGVFYDTFVAAAREIQRLKTAARAAPEAPTPAPATAPKEPVAVPGAVPEYAKQQLRSDFGEFTEVVKRLREEGKDPFSRYSFERWLDRQDLAPEEIAGELADFDKGKSELLDEFEKAQLAKLKSAKPAAPLSPAPEAPAPAPRGPLNMAGQPRAVRAPTPTRAFDTLHQKSREKFNAAWDAHSVEGMQALLHPNNAGLRAEWERRTGEKLPRGVAATNTAIADYFTKPTAAMASEPAAAPKEPAPAAVAPAAPSAPSAFSLLNLRAADATPLAMGRIKATDPARFAKILQVLAAKTPAEAARLAKARLEQAASAPVPPAAAAAKAQAEVAQVSDDVTWTTVAGDKARATVQRISQYPNDTEPMADVDWFGIKRVPVSKLEIVKKSSRRIAEEARAAKPVTPPQAAAKAQAQVRRVAATEGKRSAVAIKKDLVSELTKAWAEAPDEADPAKPTVVINIPGDGEFTLVNTSTAIEATLKRAKRIQTSAEAKAFFPRGAIESSSEAIQKSKSDMAAHPPPASPPAPGPGEPLSFFPRRSEAQGLGEQATAPTVADVRRQRTEIAVAPKTAELDVMPELPPGYIVDPPTYAGSKTWNVFRADSPGATPMNIAYDYGEKMLDANLTKEEAVKLAWGDYRRRVPAAKRIEDAPSSFFPRKSEAQGLGEQATAPTVEDVRRQRLLDREGTPVPPAVDTPTPPPADPPAAELDLPDEPAITNAIRRQDVMPGRDWLASPEFEFRKNPVGNALVTRIVEAELGYQGQVARDRQRFADMQKGLSKPQQVAITKALRAAQSGNPALLNALPPAQRTVADAIRSYFDDVRAVIIEGKRNDLIESLPEARAGAVRDILAGTPEADAFRIHRLRDAGKSAVRDALRELEELEHWGIDDYVTNIERGSYRVVTPDGTTVAIAETRSGAKEKALAYGREHPGVRRLTITDEFSSNAEFPTKLTRGQYFRMAARAARALSTDVREIQRMLRADGSPIVVVKPPSKFAGPMQHRYGILKGEENLFDALPAYSYSVRKKLALDPVFKQARTDLSKLPPNMQKQVEELMSDVRGRYHLADQIADHLLAPLGQKPFAYSRGVGVARNVEAWLKLGYRPVSALVNRLGGLQHTWTKTGARYWLEGRRFTKTPEFAALWHANADLVGATAQAFLEAGHREVPWYHPLSMFQFAERLNRPEAFASFYKYAEGELGLSGDEAAAFARKATRFGQFTYTASSLPRLLRGPTGRLVGQFKSYLVKEMEFVSSLRGFEIPRYLSAFLAMGGPRAALIMLRSLPFLGAIGALWALEDWLNRKAPRASRGLPGYLGVDMSAAVTPQLPTRATDWVGPTLSDLSRLWTDVTRPAMQGEDRNLSDLKEWGTKLAPSVMYWSRLIEAASNREGWTTDEQGRPVYKPSTADKAKLALGAKPLGQSVAEIDRAYLNYVNQVARANRARLIERILNALDKGDGVTLDKLLKDAADYGIDTDAIREAAKQRLREPDERLRRRLLKSVRVQEAERLAEPPTP